MADNGERRTGPDAANPQPADTVETGARITPYPDGPLIVRGDFVLCEVDGTPIPRSGKAVALCRCGRSAAKPFCDGSHRLAQRT